MQVTSLLSDQDPSKDQRPGARSKLWTMPLGIVLILNSFVLKWLFNVTDAVADASAMFGSILLGWSIVWNSVLDLRRGRFGINELVSIAVVASFATGDYRTAGIVAFFMLLGELIESRTAAGARAAIESLVRLTPSKARRIVSGAEQEVAASALVVGDLIRIRPGDNIAADGEIVAGSSSINEASITGESLPVEKATGDEVFAGTVNTTGVLEVKVSRAGTDTTLGKVRELILAAEKSKLPIMRLIDQYMGYYTPLVLVMGALVWMFTKDLNRVITVLVVACPCAFILATPTAMVAALAAAARLGILIKNIGDIELAARINAFVFDKTGTLTTGKLSVSRLQPADGIQPAELLRLASGAEQHSNHPVARAVIQLAGEAGVKIPATGEFSETAGRGVKATIDGCSVLVGRSKWLLDSGVDPAFESSVDLREAEGNSLLFIARDGKFIGWIGLRDQTRPEAAESLVELKDIGAKRVAMVTGDRQAVAKRVAVEIGVEEIAAECLPQDKVDYVKRLKARGYRVAVVGDGVNDAPALAAGDMSIAMGAAGSDVAINSATIALMNSDLKRLPFLMRLSRQTRAVINQNFLIGIVFIVGGLSLAAFGYLNPVIAAIMHNAGSILVIFNSARLVREGEEYEPFQPEGRVITPLRLSPA